MSSGGRTGAPSKYTDAEVQRLQQKGEFVRQATAYHHWVRKDGSSEFPVEANRYHLYISHACPWCNRVDIVIYLFGLQDVISISSVDPLNTSGKGWSFSKTWPDPLHGREGIRDVYFETDPEYAGRFTVPVLYDKKTRRIVNNESSELIRMINTEFRDLATRNKSLDLYPGKLQDRIDQVNAWVYETVNNGVYRCGFARSQQAYDTAVTALFESLDRLEAMLRTSKTTFLLADTLTEADVRLFPTLVRFDAVYVTHFKTNRCRLVDYPHLQAYMERVYRVDDVHKTVLIQHCKDHYYMSHESINPKRIVALGPDLPWLRAESLK